jgi:hypothetical protein
MGPANISSGVVLMAADTDYAMPVPPPSEDILISSLAVHVITQGVSSFIRMAVYDAEDMAALALVVDGGEVASDTVDAEAEVTFAAVMLRRNRRYLAMMCARGATRPSPAAGTTAAYCLPSWFGAHQTDSRLLYGLIVYARANAAYPAVYNGVFSSVATAPFYIRAKIP